MLLSGSEQCHAAFIEYSESVKQSSGCLLVRVLLLSKTTVNYSPAWLWRLEIST